MILSNVFSLLSATKSILLNIIDVAALVKEDGGVDKNEEFSGGFYSRFDSEGIYSSCTQVKENFLYSYEIT